MTYPLWSDNAGRCKFIRVPRGQSVRFDAATQTFTIPLNTRFYKTFLKEVIDASKERDLQENRNTPHRVPAGHRGRRRDRTAERALRDIRLEQR